MHPATPSAVHVAENRALSPASGRNWNVGQVLAARVVSADAGGGVVLSVGGQRIGASALMPLTAGQRLSLRVERTGPETVLRMLDARGGAASGADASRLLRLSPTPAVGGPGALRVLAGGQGLAAGQVLNATLLEPPGQRTAMLELAGQPARVAGELPAGLAAGQALRVQVRHRDGAMQLQLLGPAPRADPLAPAAQALRAALPAQLPLSQAFAEFARVLRQPDARSNPAARPVLRVLDELMASLPRTAELADPARLAAAVRASGLFHESLAAGAGRASGGDLKSRLMSVASVLRDALQHAAARPAIGSPAPGGAAAVAGAVPSSVLDAVDGAVNAGLARIETLQVASARAAPAQLPVWMVELPMRGREGVDELRLRIAEESRGSGDGALQVWTAELLFTPAGLSSVHARISLAPHGVVTVLTTEDRATHEHMQAAIQDLSDLFAGAGLVVAAVHCRCAALPEMGPALPLSGLVSAQA